MSEKTRIVSVIKDECTSCNQCVDNLPAYFQTDEDFLAESHLNGQHINAAPVPEGDFNAVQNEIDDCPGECIVWRD